MIFDSVNGQGKEILDGFSKELKLLVSLLQSNLLQDAACVHKTNFDFINREKFIELVRHHRVKGQIYRAVRKYKIEVPADIFNSLRTLCKNNGLTALKNTAEVVLLKKQFEQKDIPVVFFKGITLSQLLYGDPGYRHAGDIDFLIKKTDINTADEILLNKGYLRFFPDNKLTPKQNNKFISNYHHFEYFNDQKRIRLETHWDFFSNKQVFKPDLTRIFDKAQTVRIADTSFSTLPLKENIIYLMIHGAMHGYFRLFWLYDIAAFYCFKKEINWEEIYNETKTRGLERIFIQTFNLMNILWSIPLPDFIKKKKQSFSIKYITNTALKVIPAGENVFDGSGIQRLGKNVYQMLMKSSIKYKFAPVRRQFTNYHDWKLIEFPDKLFFLYYLFRPFFIIIPFFKKDYFDISINRKEESGDR